MTEWIEGRTAPPADVIERWKAAYRAANGAEPRMMQYERGWFRLWGPVVSRYRRLQVLDMISRLEARLPSTPNVG